MTIGWVTGDPEVTRRAAFDWELDQNNVAFGLSEDVDRVVQALRGTWAVDAYPTPREAAKALVDTAWAVCANPS